tara:strand:- start:2125 stop:2454 length:330 start_codon:yes stop_codon:yes gene_type:complete
MDVKQRYIRERGYDVAEDFVETLQDLDIRTGIKIVKFIDKNIDSVPKNNLVSTVLGGVIIDDDNTPVTFALELIKTNSPHIILSDIKLVHMDEYLDLLNLGLKKNKKKL